MSDFLGNGGQVTERLLFGFPRQARLDRRADQLADRLAADDGPPGAERLVAVFLERSLASVTAVLGVLKGLGGPSRSRPPP